MSKLVRIMVLAALSTGTYIYASQQAPQRPNTGAPQAVAPQRPQLNSPGSHKLRKDVCPAELSVEQMKELVDGSLILSNVPFTANPTSMGTLKEIIPSNLKVVTANFKKAHLVDNKNNPTFISAVGGHILKCKYGFRSTTEKVLSQEHKSFTIDSAIGQKDENQPH